MNFSIVIPIYNESENIINLLNEIFDNIASENNFEIILIDDYSSDNSIQLIQKYMNNQKNIILLTNKKNMGQSFSLVKGIKNSKNDIIVTLDGDGQNHPKDINKMVEKYIINNCNLVSGIRKTRIDSKTKIITSKIANKIRSFLLNDKCEDTGCGLKVFNKKIFLSFDYFNGIHRYIPALFVATRSKVIYENIDHRQRKFGKSKYGTFDRLLYALKDLIIVMILINKIKKGKRSLNND
tara:strand:+ start:713 stop:1426 length:714 start_codon:yes stop_codon:yes gene_type:complete